MLVVHVHIRVKPEDVEGFKKITIKNARNSLKEPGIIRFDMIQKEDDPAYFVLSEVYKDVEATTKHKETPHYAEWRAAAESMMTEQRHSVRFKDIFPEEKYW